MGFLLSVFQSLSTHIGKALTQSTMETIMQLLQRCAASFGGQLKMIVANFHCLLLWSPVLACTLLCVHTVAISAIMYCTMQSVHVVLYVLCVAVPYVHVHTYYMVHTLCVWMLVDTFVGVCYCQGMSVCMSCCTDMTYKICCPEVTS